MAYLAVTAAGNDRTASIRQSRLLFEDSRRKRAALLYRMSRRSAPVRDEVDSITPIAIPMVSGQRIWSVPNMMRSPRPFFKISRNQCSRDEQCRCGLTNHAKMRPTEPFEQNR